MVQTFSSESKQHNFVIDDKPYSIKGLGPDDFEKLGDVLATPQASLFPVMRDFLYSYADARTRKAISDNLGIRDIQILFRGWCGLDAEAVPGESKGSAASQ